MEVTDQTPRSLWQESMVARSSSVEAVRYPSRGPATRQIGHFGASERPFVGLRRGGFELICRFVGPKRAQDFCHRLLDILLDEVPVEMIHDIPCSFSRFALVFHRPFRSPPPRAKPRWRSSRLREVGAALAAAVPGRSILHPEDVRWRNARPATSPIPCHRPRARCLHTVASGRSKQKRHSAFSLK